MKKLKDLPHLKVHKIMHHWGKI